MTGLSPLDRPNSYIGRAVPRPNLARLLQGRGQYVSDLVLPRMVHVAFVRSPYAHARILRIDREAALARPGVVAVVTGPELATVCSPFVGVLSHLKGPEIGTATCHRRGRRLLAGRSGRRDRCGFPSSGRRRGRTCRRGLRGAGTGHRHAHRAGPRHAGNPRLPRRQPGIRTPDRCRCGGRGIRPGRRRRRNGIRLRPPYRRDPGTARGGRRLAAGRGPPHGVSGHPGATHDPECAGAASGPDRTAGSCRLQGCRRIVRHQGARLSGRTGHRRLVEDAAPAGEICRRPAGKLRHRHPCPRPPREGPRRRSQRRHHHRVRDRRPDRHRSLLHVSAHQRHRSQPGGEPGRRPVHHPELSRPHPRRVPEQDPDVPVPRRRPPDRLLGYRGPGRSGRPRHRHGPGGNPQAQSGSGRRVSLRVPFRHAVRIAVASCCVGQAAGDDGLRRTAHRTEFVARHAASIAASASPVSSR